MSTVCIPIVPTKMSTLTSHDRDIMLRYLSSQKHCLKRSHYLVIKLLLKYRVFAFDEFRFRFLVFSLIRATDTYDTNDYKTTSLTMDRMFREICKLLWHVDVFMPHLPNLPKPSNFAANSRSNRVAGRYCNEYASIEFDQVEEQFDAEIDSFISNAITNLPRQSLLSRLFCHVQRKWCRKFLYNKNT